LRKNYCGGEEAEMLREVHARNFLLFKDVSVEFHPGLNVITGETGTGKSMFIGLLRSLFGDYRAKDIIGPFERKFWIEALFDTNPALDEKLEETDIPVDEHMVVKVSGTSERYTARINGSVVSTKTLKAFLPGVFEIHSQNAFQKLRERAYHTELIDLYAGEEIQDVLAEYRELYQQYKKLLKLQKELPGNSSEMLRNLDFLRFQIEEIENTGIRDNEDEEISKELRVFSNYDLIRKRLNEVLTILEGTPEMPNVIDRIGEIGSALREVSGLDAVAAQWVESTDIAQETLSGINGEIYSYLEDFEFDEERMKELEERMKVLETLKRKYGPSLGDVLDNLKRFREERDEIDSKLEMAESLDEDLERVEARLKELDQTLFSIREKTAKRVEEDVMTQLKELKMEKVQFSDRNWKEGDYQYSGRTFLEFTASTNPGLPYLPIARIASGGEMSRIFLSLEMVLQSATGNRNKNAKFGASVVFDEIDAGVGPRLGDLIGKKLLKLSKTGMQTFVITHLPQVAAQADRHFKVGKFTDRDNTVSTIEPLEKKASEKELFEMYGKLPESI